MRIELRCGCGAYFEVEDTRGTYVNEGGRRDEHGNTYLVERWAYDWQEHHNQCSVTRVRNGSADLQSDPATGSRTTKAKGDDDAG
jgi:hypothetical protein